MTQEERQKWINEAFSLGASREKATELYDACAQNLGPILKSTALAATMAALKVMQSAMGTTTAKPPPVEIPRRVVVVGKSGEMTHSRCGTILCEDDSGLNWIVEPDDRPGFHVGWSKNLTLQLQLTDAENCRLLLEQLSRESWKREGSKPENSSKYHYIAKDGSVVCGRAHYAEFGSIPFPSDEAAIAACDTIVRAGLAWWKEGE